MSNKLVLYVIHSNTDPTEFKGMSYIARAFLTEEQAIAWRADKSDYPGWPNYRISPLELDFDQLWSPDGMAWPR